MSQLDFAIQIAAEYHRGKTRNATIGGTQLPYVTHPLEVLKKIWFWGVGEEVMFIAAVLHDTVEDTDLTGTLIQEHFGEQVRSVVEELTFIPDRNWTRDQKVEKKNEYIESFRNKSVEALVIKLADRILNVSDFLMTDPYYAKRYYHKADALYEVFEIRKKEILVRFGNDVVDGITHDLELLKVQIEAIAA
jgi:guanosine-3',5'-bis(diphosphate) 3'-pyrophosphohydrolase